MKKSPRNLHRAPFLPIPVENASDRVAVDSLGPFPCFNAGNSYVVFTEYLTRWPEAFAGIFSLRRFWHVMELLGLFFLTEELTFSLLWYGQYANLITQRK